MAGDSYRMRDPGLGAGEITQTEKRGRQIRANVELDIREDGKELLSVIYSLHKKVFLICMLESEISRLETVG